MGSLRSIRQQIFQEPVIVGPVVPESKEKPYVAMSRAEELVILGLLTFHVVVTVLVITFIVSETIQAYF